MAPQVLAPAEEETSRGPIRVVVADDSAAMRTLARHALSTDRGFRVEEAVDGIEALAAVDRFHPHCVVLDISMPRMDGFEALAKLRERAPELPVILLSGRSDGEVLDEALRCGAVSYVDKTSSLTGLADTVRRAAEGGAAPPSTPVDVPVTPRRDVPDTLTEMRRLEYVVSHDLGEPLRVINGFAGLLMQRYADALDDRGRVFLGHIVDANSRMQAMLDDLLAYSRAGRAEPKLSPTELDAVARAAVDSLAAEITERGAEIRVGPLPVVLGDETMLHTVLRHLVANGLRFNRSERPIVAIAGRVHEGSAVVTIDDNGIGIPEADRERAFDLFVRLNAREAYPGTGTGLALCRRLVTQQGGALTLGSSADGGTTVTLTLPLAPG